MGLDLIKQYLIGIGFKIDEDSLKKANSSMNNAEDSIKKFNENSKKGFSESGDTLKNLFSLINIFSQGIGKLSPELRTPFQGMIHDIITLSKIYSQFNDQLKKKTEVKQKPKKQTSVNQKVKRDSKPKEEPSAKITKNLIPVENKSVANVNLIDQILDTKNAAKSLSGEGAAAIEGFSITSVAAFAAVAVGAVAVVAGIGKLISEIGNLAKQDIENEKLSRQLWTTKETAKEVDSALKTLGISMQDLWLSPTLLKQFNQLRKDSKDLKLPKEYTENLKTVQDIGLEFARLRQLGSLAFQWIGNYILKYAAGPLKEIKQGLREFNEWLIKNIPNAAKTIGSILGVLFRIIYTVLKIGIAIAKVISPILKIIDLIKYLKNAFENLPEPVKKVLKIIGLIILALASPILALILLIEDIMTYFRGGKSVTGDFFDSIKDGMNGIKDGWDYYYNKAVEAFENIKKKAKELWDDIKNFFPNLWKGIKEKVPGVKSTIDFFSGTNEKNIVPSYTNTSNSTNHNTTTSNSNNKITQQNTFNVYGGDANSTATAVSNKVNNGINTRNLQGVIP